MLFYAGLNCDPSIILLRIAMDKTALFIILRHAVISIIVVELRCGGPSFGASAFDGLLVLYTSSHSLVASDVCVQNGTRGSSKCRGPITC
jgi:hypothetical protein